MFALALIALVVVAVVASPRVRRSRTTVRCTAPRSHPHELDPQSTRLYRVL